ncbi:hypothetical protein [Methanoregula sp.]|jgi:hypothetical protein|uniref:hypothetical protein n=1 Tax=Methanoregula sp. TaxID=2052170 RepID=UPI003C222F42
MGKKLVRDGGVSDGGGGGFQRAECWRSWDKCTRNIFRAGKNYGFFLKCSGKNFVKISGKVFPKKVLEKILKKFLERFQEKNLYKKSGKNFSENFLKKINATEPET